MPAARILFQSSQVPASPADLHELNHRLGQCSSMPPLRTELHWTGPRNGLFTKYFLNHAADSGKKIDEVFQLVAKAVEDEARTQRIEQVPYRSSSYSGAFCLASCENPEIAAELEQIKLQRAEASKRVNALQEENAQLRRQAAERSSKVAELEEKSRHCHVTFPRRATRIRGPARNYPNCVQPWTLHVRTGRK